MLTGRTLPIVREHWLDGALRPFWSPAWRGVGEAM
jgi:hypothetical protein